ncbi:hypothetical protein TCE0_023f07095 [Talaromyces pinophilus]|uniref:Enoyl reductase (ER) domain-containing protein n=1 Tax=Talaromyces pinophilus TaxID=128442 RepID=A0A0B8MY76_TALPI|nr:hypothetical protein TCE0_023f07095 [Talaromyces pinophilus]
MFIDDTVPDPALKGDRIIVRVKAFSLNRMDIWQRQQAYPYKLPEETHGNIIGVECSGIVEQLGPECSTKSFKAGDRVFGLVYGGAYAEKVSISEKMLMHLPEELSFEEGAGVPETYFTASQAIHLVGDMAPNANVLIHAGACGVGQSAIQVARLAGARKISTTAGRVKYRAGEGFAEVVSRETDGKGVGLILDLVGGNYWAQNVASAAVDSRIVIIAMMSGGKIPEFDMRPLLTKRVWICTTTLRMRSVEYQIGVRNFFVQHILPGLVERKIKAVIDKVYSWKQIGDAHVLHGCRFGAAIGNLGNLMQQLCPHPGLRAAFTGVAYNIGNAISSVAPTIETSLGERFPTSDGTPDYGRTQMILVGIVIALLITTLITVPLKSLNKEWDEEDPNAATPTIPARKDIKADLEMGGRDSYSLDKAAGMNTETVHVEHVAQNDDSITPEKKV